MTGLSFCFTLCTSSNILILAIRANVCLLIGGLVKIVSCKGFCCAGSIANMVLLDIASREPVHGSLIDDAFEELEWKAYQADRFSLFTISDSPLDTKKKNFTRKAVASNNDGYRCYVTA